MVPAIWTLDAQTEAVERLLVNAPSVDPQRGSQNKAILSGVFMLVAATAQFLSMVKRRLKFYAGKEKEGVEAD